MLTENMEKVNLGEYYSKHRSTKYYMTFGPIYLHKKTLLRDIPRKYFNGVRGCVDLY